MPEVASKWNRLDHLGLYPLHKIEEFWTKIQKVLNKLYKQISSYGARKHFIEIIWLVSLAFKLFEKLEIEGIGFNKLTLASMLLHIGSFL